MRTATDNHLHMLGIIPLYVTLGSLRRRVWFCVVDTLPLGILLGTSYIWTFVSNIDFERKLIHPKGSKPIPVLTNEPRDVNPISKPGALDNIDDTSQHHIADVIRLAKRTTLPTKSLILVPVATKANGTISVAQHWRTMPYHVLPANGVAIVCRDEQFFIYLGNFTSTDTTLPKHFRVSFARPPPTFTLDALNAGGPPLDKQKGVKIVRTQVVMTRRRTI